MPSATLKPKLKNLSGPEIKPGYESTESGSEDLLARGSNHFGDATENIGSNKISESDSDSDDAPEAESLGGGRAAADMRADAMKRHEEKLKELRKIKNKAREEFIRSTKSSILPPQKSEVIPDSVDGESETGKAEDGAAGGNPRPDRLPDSVFAAAHESIQESTERKRTKKPLKKDISAKRRRVHKAPTERVVNGRTVRVTADINEPPAISPPARKAKTPAKGGSAFRRKWKKVDAMRAQVRSRTGPSRNFVTLVQ